MLCPWHITFIIIRLISLHSFCDCIIYFLINVFYWLKNMLWVSMGHFRISIRSQRFPEDHRVKLHVIRESEIKCWKDKSVSQQTERCDPIKSWNHIWFISLHIKKDLSFIFVLDSYKFPSLKPHWSELYITLLLEVIELISSQIKNYCHFMNRLNINSLLFPDNLRNSVSRGCYLLFSMIMFKKF
jgi:hypothetical protein